MTYPDDDDHDTHEDFLERQEEHERGQEHRDVLDAVDWCRQHNAGVRFLSSGRVMVWVRVGPRGSTQRTRATFADTVEALRLAVAEDTRG